MKPLEYVHCPFNTLRYVVCWSLKESMKAEPPKKWPRLGDVVRKQKARKAA
jgi:hypothetical protein